MLTRVTTIAHWTLVELLRERVLYVVVLFAVVLVTSSAVLTPLAPGAQKKVVMDFGLAAIDVLGVLVILLTGSTLVRREMDRRSLDILLTKPLSRLEYLVGKCLGLFATLLVLMLAMTLVFAIALAMAGFEWRAPFALALLASALQMLIIASAAVLFSTFTSPTLAALFTLALFVGGHLADDLLLQSAGSAGAALVESVHWLVPALGLFNLRGDVVHGVSIPLSRMLVLLAYALLYSLTTLYVASLIFRQRDFR